ncbi:MAG: hypothetical protein OEU93_14085 [Rubrivivax sp.]|nr:hypothetical protein [Rubrivivax sp.]
MTITHYSFRVAATAIHLAWSPVNAAWLVWREDAGLGIGTRIHALRADAVADFERRTAFLRAVLHLDTPLEASP